MIDLPDRVRVGRFLVGARHGPVPLPASLPVAGLILRLVREPRHAKPDGIGVRYFQIRAAALRPQNRHDLRDPHFLVGQVVLFDGRPDDIVKDVV